MMQSEKLNEKHHGASTLRSIYAALLETPLSSCPSRSLQPSAARRFRRVTRLLTYYPVVRHRPLRAWPSYLVINEELPQEPFVLC